MNEAPRPRSASQILIKAQPVLSWLLEHPPPSSWLRCFLKCAKRFALGCLSRVISPASGHEPSAAVWSAPSPVRQSSACVRGQSSPGHRFVSLLLSSQRYCNGFTGLQPKVLQEFFNTALVSAGLVVGDGVPINDVWISAEGRYAFLEMRSPQEATNAMKLDGISLYFLSHRRRLHSKAASFPCRTLRSLPATGTAFRSKFPGLTTTSLPLMRLHRMLFSLPSPGQQPQQHSPPLSPLQTPLLHPHRDSWPSPMCCVLTTCKTEKNAVTSPMTPGRSSTPTLVRCYPCAWSLELSQMLTLQRSK